MVDPQLIAVVVALVGIAAAAVYAHTTGESTQASADIDDDGNDEVNVSFGPDEPEGESDLDEEALGVDDETPRGETETADGDEALDATAVAGGSSGVEGSLEGVDEIEDITGLGGTKGATLREAGFETPEDLYYAHDAQLLAVDGVGEYTLGLIREDIGSAHDE